MSWVSSSSSSFRKIDSFSIHLHWSVHQQYCFIETLESSQQCSGLQQDFSPFFIWIRQRDDRAANANAYSLLHEHGRSDNNVQIGPAIERKESDRSRVDAARCAFEFVDDLHRSDLRCPGHGATRKSRFQAI